MSGDPSSSYSQKVRKTLLACSALHNGREFSGDKPGSSATDSEIMHGRKNFTAFGRCCAALTPAIGRVPLSPLQQGLRLTRAD